MKEEEEIIVWVTERKVESFSLLRQQWEKCSFFEAGITDLSDLSEVEDHLLSRFDSDGHKTVVFI